MTWLSVHLVTALSIGCMPIAARAQGHEQHATPAKPSAPAQTPAKSDDEHMVGMADHAMTDMAMDSIMSLHMLLSPTRAATAADSARARALVAELRQAIAKYKDVSVAERAGYQMFAPGMKNQRVYHFTNYRNAFKEAFRFDPEQPTSLLYKRSPDGQLVLVGAMYTMPKRASLDRLDERVPLGIARWHRHVNWCVPKRGERERWLEKRDGRAVFGPQSAIATKDVCEAAVGRFYASPLGWMLHANVFAGDDLGAVFGDDHGHRG